MIQSKLPLYDALLQWEKSRFDSFHVPGHKNGEVFPLKAKKWYEAILSIDATELTGLDDLHDAQAGIKQAQQLTAQLYGSAQCFFLVGGSTAGNLAMILATCHEGDTVLVQRNSHKSIMNGLELANVNPVFLTPFVDDIAEVAVGVTLDVVKQAVRAYPNTKAIILTNPNYYGMTVDLEEIIRFTQQRGMVVLVDEAHGAHFGYGSPLPPSAVTLGADVVVQSAHKTLPAMTMGSFLHINRSYPHREKIKRYLEILQSSSPSYPIMASLDLARYYLAQFTKKNMDDMLANITMFRAALATIPNLRVLGASDAYTLDPIKVTIQSKVGMSGFEMQQRLEAVGIYPELADHANVLLVMPFAPKRYERVLITKIEQALAQPEEDRSVKQVNMRTNMPPYRSLSYSYKEMKHLRVKQIRLPESEGKVIAEPVIPYPPGIPLLLPGEKILNEHLLEINKLIQVNANFQGGNLLKDKKITVYEYR